MTAASFGVSPRFLFNERSIFMYKEVIKYTDYNGNPREEEFFFNLSKAEAVELECSINGGLTERMKELSNRQDVPEIMKIFKMLICKSYGEKSTDGKRFMKSDEITRSFLETEAYSDMFMRLANDQDYAAKFFNGIVPNDTGITVKNNNETQIDAYTSVTGNVQ